MQKQKNKALWIIILILFSLLVRELVRETGINLKEVFLIEEPIDTIGRLGTDAYLIRDGHNNYYRLEKIKPGE
jgi:hypothetical protein